MAKASPEQVRLNFLDLKPICDLVMARPSEDNLQKLLDAAKLAPRWSVQEMQFYLMLPLLANVQAEETSKDYKRQGKLVEGMEYLLSLVVIDKMDLFEMYHSCLSRLIIDRRRPGMVADVPEEFKLTIVKALNMLMLKLTDLSRIKLYSSNKKAAVAQSIYIVIHMAKREKLRSLRLAALNCVLTLTSTHDEIVDDHYMIKNQKVSVVVVEVISAILPGVLAGLQEVATSHDNQGHVIIAKTLNVMHRIMCLVMREKQEETPANIRNEDFAKLFSAACVCPSERKPTPEVKGQKLAFKTREWFELAGAKLKLVTRCVVSLQTHDHEDVRMELALFCSRTLLECPNHMAPSITFVVDTLIILTEDECEKVRDHCRKALRDYFTDSSRSSRWRTLESLSDNFFTLVGMLPRVMKNVDTRKRMSALNLFDGYLKLFADDDHPQKLTVILLSGDGVDLFCQCLVQCVQLRSNICCLEIRNNQDFDSSIPITTPWCVHYRLEDRLCQDRLKGICQYLGIAEAANCILDKLLEMFDDGLNRAETAFLVNHITTARGVQADRILETYLELNTWYLPLEVGTQEPPLTSKDTVDLTIYNPRAWDRDDVPGLYEGTVETRYTDISLLVSRAAPPRADPDHCRTVREAQDNAVLSCLLTEGVGLVAGALRDDFQPYLLRTLCLVLERAGSKYQYIHLAGMKALWEITAACGHCSVAELVRANADYFTHQVTMQLKREWNSVSALRILTVVMTYSDSSILPCLHGIMTDVLIQSFDNYFVRDVTAYLQVFLTFVTCIRKWFPKEEPEKPEKKQKSSALRIKRDDVTTPGTSGKIVEILEKTPYVTVETLQKTHNKVVETLEKTPDNAVETLEKTPGKIVEPLKKAPEDKLLETPVKTAEKFLETPEKTPEINFETPEKTPDKVWETPEKTAEKILETPENTPEKVVGPQKHGKKRKYVKQESSALQVKRDDGTSPGTSGKIVEILEKTPDKVEETLEKTPGIVVEIPEKITVKSLQKPLDKVLESLEKTPDKVKETLEKTPGIIVEIPEKTPYITVETLQKALDKVVETLEKTPDKIVETLEKTPDKILKTPEKTPDKIVETLEKTPDKIVETLEKTPDKILKTPEKTPDKIVETLEKTPDKIVETLEKTPDKILKTPEKTPDKIVETLEKTPDKILETPEKTPDKVVATLEKTPDKIVETPEITPDKIVETLKKTPEKVVRPQKHGKKPKYVKRKSSALRVKRDGGTTPGTSGKIVEILEKTPDKVEDTLEKTPGIIVETHKKTPEFGKTLEKTIFQFVDALQKITDKTRQQEKTIDTLEKTLDDKIAETLENTTNKSVETLEKSPDEVVETPEKTPDTIDKDAMSQSSSDENYRGFPKSLVTRFKRKKKVECDILRETLNYIQSIEIAEKLLSRQEFEEEMAKTSEEIFEEELSNKVESDVESSGAVKTKKPPPMHVPMVVAVLKRTVYFVSSRNCEEQIFALQTLNTGLGALEEFEDELLPLVHLIWSPLVVRFTEPYEPLVMRKAFELLVTMAELCKDFIRNRAIKEILPRLCIFLRKSAEDSLLKELGSGYRILHALNLQVFILNKLGSLARDLGLQDRPLEQVLECASLYLSGKQPINMQTAAVDVFVVALEHDYGATWHHLRALCNNRDLVTATRRCTEINTVPLVPTVGTPDNPIDADYTTNVKQIFDNFNLKMKGWDVFRRME